MFHNVNIYLHEIAMHNDHSPEDFTRPFNVGKIKATSRSEPLTPSEIDAIALCVSSAQALLSSFLNVKVDSVRSFPCFTYVRVCYAAFVLTKLQISASTPTSNLYEYLDRKTLNAESYLDLAIHRLGEVVGPLQFKVPKMFLRLLEGFRASFGNKDKQSFLETYRNESSGPSGPPNINSAQFRSSFPLTKILNTRGEIPVDFNLSTPALQSQYGISTSITPDNENSPSIYGPRLQNNLAPSSLNQFLPQASGLGQQMQYPAANGSPGDSGVITASELSSSNVFFTGSDIQMDTVQLDPRAEPQKCQNPSLDPRMDLDFISFFNGDLSGNANDWMPSLGMTVPTAEEQVPNLYEDRFEV